MNSRSLLRWRGYLMQLVLISLGLILLFTLLYWSVDCLHWGRVITREGNRETEFLNLLYFSMGTFFRIGYGDQVPIGIARWIVALEALSNFLISLIFVAQLIAASLERVVLLRVQERLEGLYRRE